MRRFPDEGFALVTALWAALILALVVSFVVKAERTDAHIAHTALRQAELRAVAHGAIALTELQLLRPVGTNLPLDGSPFPVFCAGHQVTISIQDQAGLIDLNFAPEDTLQRLFEAGGLNGIEAQVLADRVLDWREKGPGKHLNGAKASDYAAAGFNYGPREGAFESVAELRLVMGVPSPTFDRLEAALTVYSQKPVIDSEAAPKLVLEALPGMTADSAASVIRDRQLRREQQGATNPEITDVSGRSLQITAALAGDGTAGISASTVVRITGQSTLPFWTYRSAE